MVLAALAVAAVGQGGYYLVPRMIVSLLTLAAAALQLRHSEQPPPWRQPVVMASAGLVAWAVASAAWAGHLWASLPTVSVLASFACVAVVVAAATSGQRRRMASATIALAAVVALSGWAAVAFRLSKWASPESGLWRATTTVTYTNAGAAVMAAMALLALAMVVSHPSRVGRAVAMILIVGVAATLSRAGIAGLGVGYAVLLGLLGVHRVVRATVGTLVGAVIAAYALTRTMPAAHGGRPAWALLGLLVGVVLAAAPPMTSRNATRLAVGVLATAVLGAVAVLSMSSGWTERVTLSSSSRGREARAAVSLIHAHLLTGTGPGQALFVWSTPDGILLADSYAHDEYLQLTVEEGLPGAAFLLVLLAATGRQVLAGRRAGQVGPESDHRWMWAGAASGLIYLVGHGGFDFLWHVPAVVLVAALLVGLASPPPLRPLPTNPQP
jgi:O-antigen ligase